MSVNDDQRGHTGGEGAIGIYLSRRAGLGGKRARIVFSTRAEMLGMRDFAPPCVRLLLP